jgi:hypothetical protein
MGLNLDIWIFARKKSILYSGRRQTLARVGKTGRDLETRGREELGLVIRTKTCLLGIIINS